MFSEIVSPRREETQHPGRKVPNSLICTVAFANRSGRLVTGAPRLGDDLGHLVNLPLSTAEGTELLKC